MKKLIFLTLSFSLTIPHIQTIDTSSIPTSGQAMLGYSLVAVGIFATIQSKSASSGMAIKFRGRNFEPEKEYTLYLKYDWKKNFYKKLGTATGALGLGLVFHAAFNHEPLYKLYSYRY